MTVRKDRTTTRINYRRIEILIPPHIAAAVDDYRASKRPIPSEADALRWLISDSLISEGFDPYDAQQYKPGTGTGETAAGSGKVSKG